MLHIIVTQWQKTSVESDFGPFGPNLGTKTFFREFDLY